MFLLRIINLLKSKRKFTYLILITLLLILSDKLLDLLEQPNKNLKKRVNVKYQLGARALNQEFSTQMSVRMNPFMC